MSFLPMLMLSAIPLCGLSSISWPLIWISLEISSISFIMVLMKKEKQIMKEMMMKYFLIQSISSTVILFFFLHYNMNNTFNTLPNNMYFKMLVALALMMKMAMPPFHWWIMKMIKNMNWINMLIMLTWQKVIPLFMMISYSMWMLIMIISILSNVMGTMAQMNISMVKMILMFSSISHMGWMMITSKSYMLMTFLYLMIYSVLILIIMKEMKNLNMINLWKMNTKDKKILFGITILSIGGMPPMMGFMLKWFALMFLMKNNQSTTVIMIFLAMSVINFFIYSRMMTPFFLMSFKKNMLKEKYKKNKIFLLNFMVPILPFIIKK